MMEFDVLKECLCCGEPLDDKTFETETMMSSKEGSWKFSICSNCSHVNLQNRVRPQDLGAFYDENYIPYRGENAWGKYAHFVSKDQHKLDERRINVLNKYADQNAKILDFGCGKPTFLSKVATTYKNQVTGIDFSDHGWKGNQEFNDLDLRVGELDALRSGEKFDAITMWHYLEHDYNPFQTLEKLKNFAKSDGKVIIEVPNYNSHSRKKFKSNWAGYHSPRHTSLFTPKSISTLLERAGWEVVDIMEYGTLDPYTLHWMSEKEQEKIDWSGSMEKYFWDFVIGKIKNPRYFFPKLSSLGILTAVASVKANG